MSFIKTICYSAFLNLSVLVSYRVYALVLSDFGKLLANCSDLLHLPTFPVSVNYRVYIPQLIRFPVCHLQGWSFPTVI